MTTETDKDSRKVEISGDDLSKEYDADEFIRALELEGEVMDTLTDVRNELSELSDRPLDREDVYAIMYWQVPDANKGDLREFFETAERVTDTNEHRLAVRLIASLSDLTLSETEELFNELDRMRRKYGSRLREGE